MKAMLHIAGREVRYAFFSPVAYIVMVVFLAVTGWFFFSVFFLNGRADLRDFFGLLPFTLALVVPAVTMRLVSEEIASGSYEVLVTHPVSSLDILAGKYAGALAFVLIMLAPTLSYAFFAASLGDLDWGPVTGGYVGAILLSALFCAIGLLVSSLTRNQIVAFVAGLAICFALVLVENVLFLVPPFLAGPLQFIGVTHHFGNAARGVIDSRDVVYFVSATFLALHLTHVALQERS
jgi:ABC-2 type transport system permease protein